ncbi:hypothetical protein [Streptomyces cinereoruber]|uniref:hypothetical protein n=1 Tax=Streptomyces cinereoruber TaxID=67260 RepID=UPI003C2F328F
MNSDEPVFKKSRWGTNRYVYNANNPVGLALIVISTVLCLGMLLLMENRAGPFAPTPEPTWYPAPTEEAWSPMLLPQEPYETETTITP